MKPHQGAKSAPQGRKAPTQYSENNPTPICNVITLIHLLKWKCFIFGHFQGLEGLIKPLHGTKSAPRGQGRK